MKNNGKKYLSMFDIPCEEACSSKAFVDITTAERHRGLSTSYIKHNLIPQSKLARNIQLRNTQSVLFKSALVVMQLSTLSAQLGLGSEPVDWYWDTTSVPHGHLFFDMSPWTDDRLHYCTKTRSIPSKLYNPDRLKQSNYLDDEHTKFLYFPSVPVIFLHLEKSFPPFLPKGVYQVSLRLYSKSCPKKVAQNKQASTDEHWKTIAIALSKKNHLEAKKRRSGIRKRATAQKRKFGFTTEQKLLESLKNFGKLKEHKFPPQWGRWKLHLLNVQKDLWKTYFTIIWKILDTSKRTYCLNLSQPLNFEKKMLDRLHTKEYQKLWLFVHSVRQATTRI